MLFIQAAKVLYTMKLGTPTITEHLNRYLGITINAFIVSK